VQFLSHETTIRPTRIDFDSSDALISVFLDFDTMRIAYVIDKISRYRYGELVSK